MSYVQTPSGRELGTLYVLSIINVPSSSSGCIIKGIIVNPSVTGTNLPTLGKYLIAVGLIKRVLCDTTV